MCRDKVRAEGVRGAQTRDSLALCMEEVRMSCLKQAIAQNLNGPARKDFIRNCSG
jgi:hypothetical protein